MHAGSRAGRDPRLLQVDQLQRATRSKRLIFHFLRIGTFTFTWSRCRAGGRAAHSQGIMLIGRLLIPKCTPNFAILILLLTACHRHVSFDIAAATYVPNINKAGQFAFSR
jgi:hypothetical protein